MSTPTPADQAPERRIESPREMSDEYRDALIHLGVGRRGVERDGGQYAFELGGIEVVVTDRGEIQEYRSHPLP